MVEQLKKLVRHKTVEKPKAEVLQPGSEEAWLHSLKLQLNNLRLLEGYDQGTPQEIAKARYRVERIWNGGRPEWRAKGMPSRLPGIRRKPVEKPE
jgi:hypothetical protein